MLRIGLHLAARVTALSALLLSLFVAGVYTSPEMPVMRTGYPGFDVCALPCWAGILPGKTHTEEVVALLSEHVPGVALEFQRVVTQITFSAVEYSRRFSGVIYDNRGRVSGLRIRTELPLWLLIDALDTPTCIRTLSGGSGEEIVVISWEKKTHYLSGTLLLPDVSAWKPDALVMVLGIFEAYPACETPGGHPWQGFMPVWRYRSS